MYRSTESGSARLRARRLESVMRIQRGPVISEPLQSLRADHLAVVTAETDRLGRPPLPLYMARCGM